MLPDCVNSELAVLGPSRGLGRVRFLKLSQDSAEVAACSQGRESLRRDH